MSLSHLKFRHLLLVLHLQEFRNLHKAAKHLNISQPAASAMLQDLESLLGLQLFVRSRQGVVPTKEAYTLTDRARSMVHEFDALVSTVERLGRNTPPLLRLGLVPQAFFACLPKAIEHYRADGGSAALRTQEGTAQQLVSLLFDGMLDGVVGRLSSASIAEGRDMGELSFTPLYDEQICVVEGTAEAPRARPSYANLATRDWVLQRRDSSVRRELADAFLRRGLMLPEPVVETTNYIFGTAAGPHPFPAMVRDFQKIIGEEARAQFALAAELTPEWALPLVQIGNQMLTPRQIEFFQLRRGL